MKAQNGQFSIRQLNLIYSALGIFSEPTNQKNFMVLVLAMYVFFFPLTLYYELVTLVVMDSITFRANVAAIIQLMVVYSLLILLTHVKKTRWMLFYESVQTFLTDSCLNNEFGALLKANQKQLILFFGIINSIFIFPVLNICTADVELGSYETLLLPTTYPWPSNTPLWYTITTIFQCCSVSLQTFCLLGHVSFVYYSRAFITSLNAALERKITQLNTYSSESTKKQRDDEDRNRLRDIICSHRDLTRFGNQYKSLMTSYTHLCIFSFFVCGVFMMASLLRVENNLLHQLTLVNMFSGVAYQLLLLSSVGQIFDEMNTQVLGHIYDIDWFDKSIAFRKEMITFMTFLQRQQHVKVFKVKILNWVFVASIVRTTYSMLQVFMRTTQN